MSVTDIKIERTKKYIGVASPYNTEWVSVARNRLGGKWDSGKRLWYFEVEKEETVRSWLQKIFGTDGNALLSPDVSIRVTFATHYEDKGPISLAGRPIATAMGRDGGARLGQNVVLEKGGFYSSGSMKNWTTNCKAGTVVVVHKFPEHLVEQARNSYGVADVVVLDTPPSYDYEALREEKARLEKRLAEINDILTKEENPSSQEFTKTGDEQT